jgi:hypothetical protein
MYGTGPRSSPSSNPSFDLLAGGLRVITTQTRSLHLLAELVHLEDEAYAPCHP